MNNISGHILTCNCAKKIFYTIIKLINVINFFIKFTIYKNNQFFQKNSFKNLFFIYLFTIPKHRNSMEMF